jgi:hypothetical protein
MFKIILNNISRPDIHHLIKVYIQQYDLGWSRREVVVVNFCHFCWGCHFHKSQKLYSVFLTAKRMQIKSSD